MKTPTVASRPEGNWRSERGRWTVSERHKSSRRLRLQRYRSGLETAKPVGREIGGLKAWRTEGGRGRGVLSFVRPIGMDEPLLCCRKHIHQPDDYALRETAPFTFTRSVLDFARRFARRGPP